jgi:Fe-S-cluster containining protein
VPVFGHDLHRLVKQRALNPSTFTFICEQETPDKVGFRLDAVGPTYGIALDKKEKLEVTQPCTFLVEQADGTSHCGVYTDRPIACATYPMVRAPDRIAFLPNALCPSDAWTAEEPDDPQWARTLRRLARYRDTYVEVVNRWNAWIIATPLPARQPEHFVAYVLQVYDRLAALDAELGDGAVAEIEHSWATLPANAPRSAQRDTEPAWISYLRRARAVIDEFFPDLPPQPFARITL